MISIHSTGLATVVACLVGILVIHVIGDSDFCKQQWMVAHVIQTFITEELELISQAVSNCSLSNLDSKGRGPVLAPKNTNHIDIIKTIPKVVRIYDNV